MADKNPKSISKSNKIRQSSDHTPKTRRSGGTRSVQKVLRIGIVQNGRIVEERIVRKIESIFIGPTEKNHFVLPQDDVQNSRYCLFETQGPGTPYILNFTPDMLGKVSVKGKLYELQETPQLKSVRKKGEYFQLLLNNESRGKVVVGNTTILFQFVAPPPIQPKPQLPAAVRASVFSGIELVISICMIVSFSFHSGMIMYFQLNDWPEKSLEEKYRDLQELLNADTASFEKDKEKSDEELEDGEGDKEFEEEKEKADEKKKKPKPENENVETAEAPKKSAEEIARERAQKRAELAEQMAQQGVNKILASLGGSGEGAVVDVLSGGDVAADQDDLLEQVRGVGVSQGDGDSKLSGPAGGKGGEQGADVSQVKSKGGDSEVKTQGPGPEKSIRGTVKKREPMASGGTGMMSSGDVASVVNRRIGAIKGCYERALKRDPSLQGKITIRFTISGSGKVTTARPTLNQLNNEVGECITQAFTRFRFPPPEGGTVTFEYPFLFTPAN
ncbi:MAG: AgmX/PglI C-terminal domain-containing protein [Deltaproteobacteria bacterium]|nr:AgmX/PglI C-terminal domain-containing protein [Deltaproteobacteria bacterium]MBN2673584.1 AgmX/PglI C-terminal domain-containing protein [Deltaproteobacteria bacterium]